MKKGAQIHPTACVDEGAVLGEDVKVWHFCHISTGSQIGEGSTFGQNVFVAPNVKIGKNCKIQNNVSVYEGVELQDSVFCGPSMVFTNVKNPRCEFPQRGGDHYLKTLVKRGATLGANCTVVCGTTINEYAFVAAGSVVTKDVPEFALVAGAPAKVVGWMSRSGVRCQTQEEARLESQ